MSRSVDLLLTICPPFSPETPHIGVGYLAEYLESHGVNVEVYDLSLASLRQLPETERHYWTIDAYEPWGEPAFVNKFWDDHDLLLERHTASLLAYKPRAIGFSVRLFNFVSTMRIIQRVRAWQPEITILAGGTDFFVVEREGQQQIRNYGFPLWRSESRHLAYTNWLEQIDAIVLGEGEETTLEVMGRLREDRDLDGIPGTARVQAGRHEVNPRRPQIEDLDSLPFPTYQHFDLQSYTDPGRLAICTSRGCQQRCSFCVERLVWGKQCRCRSAGLVVEEMRYHNQHNGVAFFKAVDQLLNADVPRLAQISEGLMSERLLVNWGGNLVVNPKMDLDFFRMCKRAGAHTFTFGIESGAERILQLMRKGFRYDAAEANLADCRQAEIKTRINLILGFPSETEGEFLESIAFVTRNAYNITTANLLRACLIYHDTDLARNPERYNLDPAEVATLPELFALPNWRDRSGMDIHVRQERVSRCRDRMIELGISLDDRTFPPGWHRRKEILDNPDQWSWLVALGDAWNAGPYPIETLLELGLEHEDPLVRAGSAKLAGLMRSDKLQHALRRGMRADDTKRVREMCARALSLIGNPDFVLEFEPLLESIDTLEPPFKRDLMTMVERQRYNQLSKAKGDKS